MPAYQDSIYAVSITLLNESGGAVDITGYDLAAKFYRPHPSNCSPVVITEGNGITVADSASGNFTLNLTVSQVNSLGVGPVRVEIFRNYTNAALRSLLLEGSEVVEGRRFDA